MTVHRALLPAGWPRPKGYANGIIARGTSVWTGGVVGWDEAEAFPTGLPAQLRKCLENTVAILAEGGAAPEHIVRMTWYVTDIEPYPLRSLRSKRQQLSPIELNRARIAHFWLEAVGQV